MTTQKDGPSPEALRAFGKSVDFDQTAEDYATYRTGFPRAFFELLTERGFAIAGQIGVDLGTGTGTLARGLALRGLTVTGIDPAPDLMKQARALDAKAGATVHYQTGTAEKTGIADHSVDLVTAGQCWHWFDRSRAAAEVARILRPGGRVLIAHFDWLPLPGNVVAATEALILKHNPAWAGANGSGIYPAWLADLAQAGFTQLETASFDIPHPYSPTAWRGRIRASAGIAASLSPTETAQFDEDLATLLANDFPDDPLLVPHRVWLTTGIKPPNAPASNRPVQ